MNCYAQKIDIAVVAMVRITVKQNSKSIYKTIYENW